MLNQVREATRLNLAFLRESANTTELISSTVAINLLSTAMPLVLMQVYDRVLTQGNQHTLIWLGIGATAAIALESILRGARGLISAWLAVQYGHLKTCDTVELLLRIPIGPFLRRHPAHHMEQMGAIDTLQRFYSGQAFQLLLDVPFALVFLVLVGYLGGLLALVPIGIGLSYVVAGVGLNRQLATARRHQLDAGDRRSGYLVEVLKHIHTAKAASMEESLLRRAERLQAERSVADLQVSFSGNMTTQIGASLVQFTSLATIGLGAIAVVSGDLSIGAVTACGLLSGRVIQPLQQLTLFAQQLSEVDIANSRVAGLTDGVDLASLPDRMPTALQGAIEIHAITFAYPEQPHPVVRDISLQIEAGHRVAVHGASLSGTSTFLQLIAGLLKPQSGSVLLDESDTGTMRPPAGPGGVAYVPAIPSLYDGTLLDNLTLFDDAQIPACLEASRRVELEGPVADLPAGYQTQVSSGSTSVLSTRLLQRLGLARALARRPKILLLDKCDLAMDNETLTIYADLLAQLHTECTVVVVTSRLDLLKIVDEVYELVDGRLEISQYIALMAEVEGMQT